MAEQRVHVLPVHENGLQVCAHKITTVCTKLATVYLFRAQMLKQRWHTLDTT